MAKLLWLAGAGALGTLCRYAVAGWVQRGAGAGFPWGTVAVNVAGCFLAGFVWSLADTRGLISTETRILILLGFMGAFTTFSTFGLETSLLIGQGQWARALGNVLLQNSAGLVAVFAGLSAGRLL